MKYEVQFPNQFTGKFIGIDFVLGKAIVDESLAINFQAIHKVSVKPIEEEEESKPVDDKEVKKSKKKVK